MCVVDPTLQAQTLHPLSDTAAVRRIVEQLGDELSRRMTAAGAMPGSRQVGWLLAVRPSTISRTCTCRGWLHMCAPCYLCCMGMVQGVG
jgi:hypothetical protein